MDRTKEEQCRQTKGQGQRTEVGGDVSSRDGLEEDMWSVFSGRVKEQFQATRMDTTRMHHREHICCNTKRHRQSRAMYRHAQRHEAAWRWSGRWAEEGIVSGSAASIPGMGSGHGQCLVIKKSYRRLSFFCPQPCFVPFPSPCLKDVRRPAACFFPSATCPPHPLCFPSQAHKTSTFHTVLVSVSTVCPSHSYLRPTCVLARVSRVR